MPKSSGGGGSGGRSGGGGGDAGQPGEVVRAANDLQAAREAYNQAVQQMNKHAPRTDAWYAAKKKADAAMRNADEKSAKLIAAESGAKVLSASERASRNLEFSRQSDIMEGGKSFKNPSVYKSNAPPKYNPKPAPKTETKTEAKKYKEGDIVSNARGRFRMNKYGMWDRA